MTPLNPLFAVLVFLIGFLVAYLINLKYQLKSPSHRYETLDGLRGFLAISVFIHHTSVWYGYLQTGSWMEPNSNLFNHLGQSSVSLFFMISSFLFISKLLIVGVLSDWTLKVSNLEFLKNLFRWAGLGVLGQPDLNGVGNTAIINSFVNWSLLYEWFLYFSLPLISLFILKKKPSIFYLVISVLFILFAWQFRNLLFEHLLSLIGGAVAAILNKNPPKKINLNHFLFSLLTIGSLVMVVQFSTSGHLISKLLLILAFTLIAMGNDLFGLLKNSSLKFMGEISYSTYLLHGILLFGIIHFGYGIEATKILSPFNYCLMMLAITPVLVGLSFLTYIFIEKPFINRSKQIRKKLVEV